jgi:hypothetical protein
MSMQPRVKIFTYVSGERSTLLESELEENINEWLANTGGQLLQISQSESQRPGASQHVTVCIWYVPDESAAESPSA